MPADLHQLICDVPWPLEINLAALMEKTRGQRRVEVPRDDLNYGFGRRIQLKFEMPWVALQEAQRTETSQQSLRIQLHIH